MKEKSQRRRGFSKISGVEPWLLKLYVTGTQKSINAISSVKKVCGEQYPGKYRIKVIDILKNPAIAKKDGIIAIPTLIMKSPFPLKLVGDMTDTARVIAALNLKSAEPNFIH